jgi:hypothetical protein
MSEQANLDDPRPGEQTLNRPANSKPVVAGSESQPREGKAGRAWHQRAYRAAAAAGVVVGLLVGLTSLVDWIRDSLSDAPSASTLRVRIERITLRKNVPLADYVRTANIPEGNYTPSQLRTYGNMVFARLAVEGYKGRTLRISWSMHHADSQVQVRGADYNQDAGLIQPAAQKHTAVAPVWVPLPNENGSYFVRVMIKDPSGQLLEQRDSPTFDVVPFP